MKKDTIIIKIVKQNCNNCPFCRCYGYLNHRSGCFHPEASSYFELRYPEEKIPTQCPLRNSAVIIQLDEEKEI